jgi:hypothetical protein
MARPPREPPAPVPPPPRLVRLRVTEGEADLIVRVLRSASAGDAQALADVLAEETALLRRPQPRR